MPSLPILGYQKPPGRFGRGSDAGTGVLEDPGKKSSVDGRLGAHLGTKSTRSSCRSQAILSCSIPGRSVERCSARSAVRCVGVDVIPFLQYPCGP